MCGICGIISYKSSDIKDKLYKMNRLLVHRGPDDEGYFVQDNVGLAMRRLSIIDLESGHQPIYSQDDNLVIIFNGEIYNYKDIKKAHLSDYSFKTKSDTEVILNLYHKYGTKSLEYLNGMFAFAIYDKKRELLFVARDRLGIKPLYYYKDDNYFLFSSEIKSFYCLRDIDYSINYKLLNDYLSFGFIPQPHTIFTKVKKLSPGHYLVLRGKDIAIKKYWSLGNKKMVGLTFDSAKTRLRELLSDSIKYRMISDVPVGVFLSGGVDSSIVTYEMSRLKGGIDSFTIGFKLASNNGDVIFSRIISRHLGTKHHETIIDPSILSELEPVFSKMDEPFAITSMLPVYLNSKVTSKKIKVVLSGDGADELFGGYSRHRFFKYLLHLRKAGVLPISAILKIADSLFTRFDNELIRKGNYYILKPILKSLKTPQLAGKYLSFLECIDQDEKQKLLDPAITEQFDELVYVKDFNDFVSGYGEQLDLNLILDFDMKTTLVGEMLSKVDKASMLSSLEVRVPFLDHRLVEFISSLPFDFKVGRKGKHILKECYKGLIPDDVLYTSKRGFNLPLDNWIRSSWKNEFYETFLSSQTEEIGFNKDYLINQLNEFCENGKIIGGKKFFFAYCLIRWYGNFMAAINDKN